MDVRPTLIALLLCFACGSEIVDSGSDASDVSDSGADAGVVEDPCLGCLPSGTAPVRRADMAFAVDPETNRVFMLFGDRAEPQNCNFPVSDFMDDGYLFHGALERWEPIAFEGAVPLPRARSSGVWDPTRKRVLVFGGRWRPGTSGAYTFLNDLWALDPETRQWEELSTQGAPGAPTGRMNTLMVADATNDRVIIHAGGQTDFLDFQVNSETWTFDLGNRTWAQIATAQPQPPPRLFHTGALDVARQQLYIFSGGGQNAFEGPFYGDLWVLDLGTQTWSQLGNGPEGRIKGAMDFDIARNRLLLFAGHNNTPIGNDNELWSFDVGSGTWTLLRRGDTYNAPPIGQCDFPADFALIDPESPERRESHLFLINGDRAFMHGGRTDCGLANDTWILDLSTDTWRELNPSFTGMTCYRSGRTDCDDSNARKCG